MPAGLKGDIVCELTDCGMFLNVAVGWPAFFSSVEQIHEVLVTYKKSKNVKDYKISGSRMTRIKNNVAAIKSNNDNELKMVAFIPLPVEVAQSHLTYDPLGSKDGGRILYVEMLKAGGKNGVVKEKEGFFVG